MLTIAALSQKGGAGKSTLCRHLSVLAAEEGRTLVVDRDPQATIGGWIERRSQLEPAPSGPELVDLGKNTVAFAVEALRGDPANSALFFDTRPAVGPNEAEVAREADVVIVPVRPSMDDLDAVTQTLDMLERLGRRALLIVNSAKSDRRAKDARAALAHYPVSVCPQHITDRAVFLDAALTGQGVSEMKGAAAEAATAELRRVWQWVKETARG